MVSAVTLDWCMEQLHMWRANWTRSNDSQTWTNPNGRGSATDRITANTKLVWSLSNSSLTVAWPDTFLYTCQQYRAIGPYNRCAPQSRSKSEGRTQFHHTADDWATFNFNMPTMTHQGTWLRDVLAPQVCLLMTVPQVSCLRGHQWALVVSKFAFVAEKISNYVRRQDATGRPANICAYTHWCDYSTSARLTLNTFLSEKINERTSGRVSHPRISLRH